MSVCCECCVLSGRGLCVYLITRPEEFYRLLWVVVCDLETSWMRKPWPTGGCCTKNKQNLYACIYSLPIEAFWAIRYLTFKVAHFSYNRLNLECLVQLTSHAATNFYFVMLLQYVSVPRVHLQGGHL